MARKRISRWLKRRGFKAISAGIAARYDYTPYYIRWEKGAPMYGNRIVQTKDGWVASGHGMRSPVLPSAMAAFMYGELQGWRK